MTSTRTTRFTLAALTLALAACSKGGDGAKTDTAAPATGTAEARAAAPAAAPAPVVLGAADVATAESRDIGAAITVSGPLEPKEVVVVRAQVGGTLQTLGVDRGNAVRRGQRLATIQAEALRSQAAGAQASVAAAQAGLAVAKQRLDAAKTLREAGAMSEIDYRTAVATTEAAEAQLAAARAQSASAGEAWGFTTVSAPIDGVVSERKVQRGDVVKSGDEIVTVVNTRTLELSGRVGVEDAGRVRVGLPVVFAIDALPGEALRGRVARIDPTADPATRQVGVYVELPNPGGRIVGGQFARGSIATGTTRAIVIPESAVLGARPGAPRAGAPGDSAAPSAERRVPSAEVFVIENNRLVRRRVTLGVRDENAGLVAVTAGLEVGDKVLATPTADTADGATVTMAADGAPGKE